ncbi:hypothetical protein GCM10007416_29860 [Kroppenstedtia guangzhouensis]|uniref:Uncharacterized protein n=1 Tax=Kroppenstedtia guangzhouensis TaxID=1274356 RepID=A0ABQ1H2H8_9BACL|nr:hypothetical protein GCM10007416_29860 [Kroppenstedtia guangzhouensis]
MPATRKIAAESASGSTRDQLKTALHRAFEIKKPVILDVLVDPDEAPMPAQVTFSQAKNYAIHLLKEWWEERKDESPTT